VSLGQNFVLPACTPTHEGYKNGLYTLQESSNFDISPFSKLIAPLATLQNPETIEMLAARNILLASLLGLVSTISAVAGLSINTPDHPVVLPSFIETRFFLLLIVSIPRSARPADSRDLEWRSAPVLPLFSQQLRRAPPRVSTNVSY
jgi:hypothetical protein